MSIGKKLKMLRSKSDLSLDELASNLNKSVSQEEEQYIMFNKGKLSKWENDREEPKLSALKYVADFYDVSVDSIISDKDNHNLGIPLIGKIAAGTPIFADQNIEDYFTIDSRIDADFCLRIQGDSMIDAGINNDDIVFIRQQPTLEVGEIGAIQIEEEATLKRFYRTNDSIILQPANSDYLPQVYTSDSDIKILGKLVATLHIYK
ncbi:repressor LexA [Finegoldia magna]|uniref:Repressor LexA n=1 Tax=Finegoldia magna TaxID=1260 RepID=A0A233V9N6_FINMA|nr:transcriptional repressor LexA [Finegoldia magna]OXZ29120.1 repressor LexA [Finegoldia magna]